MLEFKAWPKTPRLNRDMIVTEKINGTNAAVIIADELDFADSQFPIERDGDPDVKFVVVDGRDYIVAAQSRNRRIWPGKATDNSGFARWVWDNAETLVSLLGTGYHYGEWWGLGIQQGYGQDRKRFSLFNVVRYAGVADEEIGLDTVPILCEGPFWGPTIDSIVAGLKINGSVAAPGQPAEGAVVFHTAAGMTFKVTCEKDESPKGANQ